MAISTNLDNFDLPYIINLRKRNEVVDKIETDRGVMYGIVPLEEIPERNSGISIDGFTRIQDGSTLQVNQFRVDYANGLVYVNPELYPDGTVLPTIRYRGKGVILISADRVFTSDGSGRTLGDVSLGFEEKLDKDFRLLPKEDFNDLSDNDLIAIYDSEGEVIASLTFADLRAGVQKIYENTYDTKTLLIETGKINPEIKNRGQLTLNSEGAGADNSIWENDGRPNIIPDNTYNTTSDLVTAGQADPTLRDGDQFVLESEGFGLNDRVWRYDINVPENDGWYNTGLTTDEDGWYNTQRTAVVTIELILALEGRVKNLEDKTVNISNPDGNNTIIAGLVTIDNISATSGFITNLTTNVLSFTNLSGQVANIDNLTIKSLYVEGETTELSSVILDNREKLTNITYNTSRGETVVSGFVLMNGFQSATGILDTLNIKDTTGVFYDVNEKINGLETNLESNNKTIIGFNSRISNTESRIGISAENVPTGLGLLKEVADNTTGLEDLERTVRGEKANLLQIVEDPNIETVTIDGVVYSAITSNVGLKKNVINSMSFDNEQAFNIKIGEGLELVDDISPTAPDNSKVLNVTVTGGGDVGTEVVKADILNSDINYQVGVETNIPYDTVFIEDDAGITWDAVNYEFTVENAGTIFAPRVAHSIRKGNGVSATAVFRFRRASDTPADDPIDDFKESLEESNDSESISYTFQSVETTQDNEVFKITFEPEGNTLDMVATSTQRMVIGLLYDVGLMSKAEYVNANNNNINPVKVDGVGANLNITDTHIAGQVIELDDALGSIRVPYPELPATTTTAEGKFNYLRDITNIHKENINDNADEIDRVSDFAELKIREHDLFGVVNVFTQDLLGQNTIEDGSIISVTLKESTTGSVSGTTTFVDIGGNTNNNGAGVVVLDEYGNNIPATKYLDKLVELRYSQDLLGDNQVFVLRNLYTESTYNAVNAGFDWVVNRPIKLIEDDVIRIKFIKTDYSGGSSDTSNVFIEFEKPDGSFDLLLLKYSENGNTSLMKNYEVNGETLTIRRTATGVALVGNPPLKSINSDGTISTISIENGGITSTVTNPNTGESSIVTQDTSGLKVNGLDVTEEELWAPNIWNFTPISNGFFSNSTNINSVIELSNGTLFSVGGSRWFISNLDGSPISDGVFVNAPDTTEKTIELSNGTVFSIGATSIMNEEDFTFIDENKWNITNLDGSPISNGLFSSIPDNATINTTIELSNGTIFSAGDNGRWNITNLDGSPISDGEFSFAYSDIFSSIELSNGTIFNLGRSRRWLISDLDGNPISNGSFEGGFFDIPATSIELSNGTIFSGGESGSWVISNLDGSQISSGRLVDNLNFGSVVELSNGTIFTIGSETDGDGNWNVLNLDGSPISNGVHTDVVLGLNHVIELSNGTLFIVGNRGQWYNDGFTGVRIRSLKT